MQLAFLLQYHSGYSNIQCRHFLFFDFQETTLQPDNADSFRDKKYTRYYLKKNIPIKEKLLKSLGSKKLLVVDEIADSFGNLSLQNLLDIVYNLPIVKNSKMDSLLDIIKDIEAESEEEKNALSDLPF